MAFTKAIKYATQLRMAIAGPAGAGKTFTALTLATALADGQDIALIDTEHGSARKYADLFSFDVDELETFHPNTFIKAIQEAEQAGYAVLVIDSLSHAWNGKGGLLEIVDSLAVRKYKNNTFNAWREATPLQSTLIDTILTSKMHIIATMRSKTEYEVETINGKATPRKVGMAPIQRDGVEYEFDIVGDMDIAKTMIVQKSRCPALSGQMFPKPDSKVIKILKPWLQGAPMPERQDAPTTHHNGQENALTVKSVYEYCVEKKACTSKQGFYAYASAVLGANVSPDTVMQLNQEQLQQLVDAANEEQAS